MENEFDRYWQPYCEALWTYDIIDDPRYCTREATLVPENCRECIRLFEAYAIQKTSEEIGEKLEEGDIVYTVLKHFKDNHSNVQALINDYMISTNTLPEKK